jgi:hypothetical protein
MKNLQLIILIIATFIFSCGSRSNVKEVTTESRAIDQVNIIGYDTTSLLIDTTLIAIIKNYYFNYHKKIIVSEKDPIIKMAVNEEKQDSVLNLTYQRITGYLEGDFIVSGIYIPLYKKADSFFKGDVDGDGKEDLLIVVYTEGEYAAARGGDAGHGEIITFKNLGDKFEIIKVTNDRDLSGCNHGHFYPMLLKNGVLIGESHCYKEDSEDYDPYCCPSLYYQSKVKFENGDWKFLEKKYIKRVQRED